MVNKGAKMNLVLFAYFTIILGCSQSHEVEDLQKQCDNNVCLRKTPDGHSESEELGFEAPATEMSEEFNFPNSTNGLSEKEIYMVQDLGQILHTDLNGNSHAFKLQIETTTISVETFGETVSSSTDYRDNLEEMINATLTTLGATDVSFETVPSKATNIPTTEMTVTKSNKPTTQIPPSGSQFPVKQIYKKDGICFCDLKVDECDINCCCDTDCTQSHFKVFTKCVDDQPLYDSKYCYKNYFIFANNTPHKLVQKNGGLFCIARENVKISLNYKTKPPLTTLEAFEKNLPSQWYSFSYKTHTKSKFKTKSYLAGSPVWAFQNGEFRPFKIPHSSVGLLCNSEVNTKYLVDQETTCFIQLSNNECEGKKIRDVLHSLRNLKIISNPGFINVTQQFNSSKICDNNRCIKITLHICQVANSGFECLKITENSTDPLGIDCWNVLTDVEYQILHNGSEGIQKVESYLWIKKLQRNSNQLLSPHTTNVKYRWVGSSKKVLKRSGNPGYITGKPVVAGRKIYMNETTVIKEAMQVSDNPNDWLSVLGSKKGICSFKERIPINFRENGQFVCSLELSRANFTKEKCLEVQNNIYKLLVGEDITNLTKENYFNKFVATFGNSRVEETGDWVQVLIDLFLLSSSQASFKSNHYRVICKNIVTDLNVDIVYANIGSVLAPQAKILGVFFHFGKHKDLIYHCDSPGCDKTSQVQYFKLSTSIRFVDITEPPIDAFAEPLYLEVKLPHDFFYPFFSRGYRSQVLNRVVFILILSIFF